MSTNISKEKREKLVEKIKEIKNYVAFAPQDENTAKLLTYIADIEKDIRGKKYGLVFEEHRESIDELLETHTPVLTENESLFIDNGGQMNFLIEGDNLASLQLLEKTHKGKIDLIYIDPPYNTGNKDFVYDDVFVDSADLFAHSKWLSFMEKRLKIAKNLLSENGVIFISIDDNEQAQLKLLCDEIFGIQCFVDIFSWCKTETPANLSLKTKKALEYILCYTKTKNQLKFKGLNKNSTSNNGLMNQTNSEHILVFPANIVDTKLENGIYKAGKYGTRSYEITLLEDTEVLDGMFIKPVKLFGKFKWQQDYLENEIKKGTKISIKTNAFSPSYEKTEYEPEVPWNLINRNFGVGTNENASAEIKDIFGKSIFSFPKPVSLISYIIRFNDGKTILDFFAGSGTTGHAVMKLNAEDGGKRKFILCTNNENNICRDVTYERIKRVIAKENYEASLKYFKVDYLPISDKLYYEYADELLKHIKELVELENGINFNGNEDIAIILTEEELDKFMSALPTTCRAIYLGHDMLPSEEQESLFKKNNIAVNIIPDYYYKDLEG